MEGIFAAAGAERLQNACDLLAPINTGEAVFTQGFNLLAKFIIHTAGPIYQDGNQREEELLRACYMNSLELATKNGCESIAFPLISSGIYSYPKACALRVATSAIRDYISEHDIEVSLVVFDKSAFEIKEGLLRAVESFVDSHIVYGKEITRRQYIAERQKYSSSIPPHFAAMPAMPPATANMIKNLDEPFSTTLLRLIDASGKKDSEVYR